MAPQASAPRRPRVCLFSFHPLVLPLFEGLLKSDGLRLHARAFDPDQMPSLRTLTIPRAAVYVIDAHARSSTTQALASGILERFPEARLVIVSESFSDAAAYPLLRLGAKGLLTYVEASKQLPRAIREVAAGGYWVPRVLLGRFVESSLRGAPKTALIADTTKITRREREVLESLLQNMSNKEIARKLQVSERTAKFHVSNLLAKYGVRRRADLILLNYTESEG